MSFGRKAKNIERVSIGLGLEHRENEKKMKKPMTTKDVFPCKATTFNRKMIQFLFKNTYINPLYPPETIRARDVHHVLEALSTTNIHLTNYRS